MGGDLENLMAQAAGDLEAVVPPVPSDALTHMRTAVHHRRLLRHATESLGALAVVGVLAAALVVGRPAPQPAEPTPAPTPSATPTATPDVTRSPTPPAGPPVRDDEIEDATALARLGAPRTGEVWTPPERVDAPVNVTSSLLRDWYLVGTRGDAQIYAVTDGSTDGDELDIFLSGLDVSLYELRGGALTYVACPSARTGDACGTPLEGVPATSDTTTFYDSLTPPRTIALPGGYRLRTGATWGTEGAATGSMLAAHYGDEVRVHADLGGGMQVVERVVEVLPADHPLADARNINYALRLPYGALVQLVQADVPGGDSATIVWDDGVSRAGERSRTWAPGGGSCTWTTFSVLPGAVDRSTWVRGGTVDGRTVYVPAPGHLELATTVFTWQEQTSSALSDDLGFLEGADAYPIDSVDELVASNALFALEGAGGEWLVGLRGDALATAYECS